jgi:hypothetical protein
MVNTVRQITLILRLFVTPALLSALLELFLKKESGRLSSKKP